MQHSNPRIYEELVAAHKARQARFAAAAIKTSRKPVQQELEPKKDFIQRSKEWEELHRAKEEMISLQAVLAERDSYPNVRQIIACVADHYKITYMDIISHRRTHNVIVPRHIAMYLAKAMTPFSLNQISQKFSNRDHSTTHSAVHKIQRLIDGGDEDLKAVVNKLRNSLTEACK